MSATQKNFRKFKKVLFKNFRCTNIDRWTFRIDEGYIILQLKEEYLQIYSVLYPSYKFCFWFLYPAIWFKISRIFFFNDHQKYFFMTQTLFVKKKQKLKIFTILYRLHDIDEPNNKVQIIEVAKSDNKLFDISKPIHYSLKSFKTLFKKWN